MSVFEGCFTTGISHEDIVVTDINSYKYRIKFHSYLIQFTIFITYIK